MSGNERVYTCFKYTLPEYANRLDIALEYLDAVVKKNIPFMLEWFGRVRTTDDVIAELDRQLGTNDYRDYHRYWTKAFLLAYEKRLDEAVKTMQVNYSNRAIEQKVLDKLQAASLLKL